MAAVEDHGDGDEQGPQHAGAREGDIQPTSADMAGGDEQLTTREETSSITATVCRPTSEQEDETFQEAGQRRRCEEEL